MFPVLRPILNRGGAGYSISRAETVERLRPLIGRGLELQQLYAETLPTLPHRDGATRLAALMPYLRTEVGKLYETVFSSGGRIRTYQTPDASRPTGELHPDALTELTRAERAFGKALRDEIDAVHHQERTRAVLKSVAAGSAGRLDVLREMAAGRRGQG